MNWNQFLALMIAPTATLVMIGVMYAWFLHKVRQNERHDHR